MNKPAIHPVFRLWRRLWRVKPDEDFVWWQGLLLSAAVGATVGGLVIAISALTSGQVLNLLFWKSGLAVSMQIGSIIMLLTHLCFRALGRCLPAAWVAAVNEGSGSLSLWVYLGMPTLCSCLALVLWDTVMRARELGYPVLPQIPDKHDLASFLLCGALLSLLSLWRLRAELRAQRLKQQMSEAQLRLLQAQIEPHFLFNTLANVQGLIDYEPALARRMLDAFTDYLRASLQQLRATDVPLSQELELVQSYLTVMQCRMGKRLQFKLDLPAELANARVPPLLLQPLVENAIHHGLEPQVQGGLLHLRAMLQGEGLRIEVEDDGVGLTQSQQRSRPGHGVALKNIRERLQVAYGALSALELGPGAEGRGTCVVLKLPARRPRVLDTV